MAQNHWVIVGNCVGNWGQIPINSRPIIMTTLAMGAGMIPIAVGWGAADPSFRSPMAVAVIGGLITSTILSLLVSPSVFSYLDDLKQGIKRTVARLRGRPSPPVSEAPAEVGGK